ncbi:MAG TPA: fibronectin type III domain-containing protein [Myxococcales bacterium]|nr:fibronectin type III domain-containing protein [Myxococcales bacterium]
MRVLSILALAAALGCGGGSARALPPAPQGLTAKPELEAVLLQWSGVPDSISYVVYTSIAVSPIANGKVSFVSATGADSYLLLESGLTSGVAYHFAVSAVNDNGRGPLSAEASATPQ